MKKRRYRWECPECGKSKLGSQRPSLESAVRFCFPCSEMAGSLVRTSSPVLKSRADAKSAKAKTKRTKAKAKADEKWIRAGLDVRKETQRCAKAIGITVPEVTIRNRKDGHHSGRSYKGRIVLSLSMEATRGEVLSLIAHEIAHEAFFWTREGHGSRWRRKFLEVVRLTYGADPGDPGGSSHELHSHISNYLQ